MLRIIANLVLNTFLYGMGTLGYLLTGYLWDELSLPAVIVVLTCSSIFMWGAIETIYITMREVEIYNKDKRK